MTTNLIRFPTKHSPPAPQIDSTAWHREAKHFATAFMTEVAVGNRDNAERLAQHALRCLDAAMRTNPDPGVA